MAIEPERGSYGVRMVEEGVLSVEDADGTEVGRTRLSGFRGGSDSQLTFGEGDHGQHVLLVSGQEVAVLRIPLEWRSGPLPATADVQLLSSRRAGTKEQGARSRGIRSAQWHPMASGVVVVLTSDQELALHSLDRGDRPVAQYRLAAAPVPAAARASAWLRSPSSPLAAAVTESPDFVDFCYGSVAARSAWDRWTVYLLASCGDVYALCPVLPPGFVADRALLHDLMDLDRVATPEVASSSSSLPVRSSSGKFQVPRMDDDDGGLEGSMARLTLGMDVETAQWFAGSWVPEGRGYRAVAWKGAFPRLQRVASMQSTRADTAADEWIALRSLVVQSPLPLLAIRQSGKALLYVGMHDVQPSWHAGQLGRRSGDEGAALVPLERVVLESAGPLNPPVRVVDVPGASQCLVLMRGRVVELSLAPWLNRFKERACSAEEATAMKLPPTSVRTVCSFADDSSAHLNAVAIPPKVIVQTALGLRHVLYPSEPYWLDVPRVRVGEVVRSRDTAVEQAAAEVAKAWPALTYSADALDVADPRAVARLRDCVDALNRRYVPSLVQANALLLARSSTIRARLEIQRGEAQELVAAVAAQSARLRALAESLAHSEQQSAVLSERLDRCHRMLADVLEERTPARKLYLESLLAAKLAALRLRDRMAAAHRALAELMAHPARADPRALDPVANPLAARSEGEYVLLELRALDLIRRVQSNHSGFLRLESRILGGGSTTGVESELASSSS